FQRDNRAPRLVRGANGFHQGFEGLPRQSTPKFGRHGITHSARRRSEPALPSGIPGFQHGAWLPASPHPKYKAHAPSEGNREFPEYRAVFLKRARSARSYPANSQESAATRGACGFERLQAL